MAATGEVKATAMTAIAVAIPFIITIRLNADLIATVAVVATNDDSRAELINKSMKLKYKQGE